jgi:predicted transcriptional regulator
LVAPDYREEDSEDVVTTMPETVHRDGTRTDTEQSRNDPEAATGATDMADSGELLSLLSDDNAREILTAITEEQLRAREIADRLDISRTTVYRRLNQLEAIGVVETSFSLDPDGHHCKQFHAALDQVVVSIGADRIAVAEATVSDADRTGEPSQRAR